MLSRSEVDKILEAAASVARRPGSFSQRSFQPRSNTSIAAISAGPTAAAIRSWPNRAGPSRHALPISV